MTPYHITVEPPNLLRIGFGDLADNRDIVRHVDTLLSEMDHQGKLPAGQILRINGKASLPVMATIVHKVAHTNQAVAVFDPKLDAYVVAITHTPSCNVGDLLPE